LKSIVIKVFILFFLITLCVKDLHAQNFNQKYTISWLSDTLKQGKIINPNSDFTFPRYWEEKFGQLPSVYLKIAVNSRNNSVNLNIEKQSELFLDFKSDNLKLIKSDPQLNYQTVLENGLPYVIINFLPIIKTTIGFNKIDEYSIEINNISVNAPLTNTLRNYHQNSVLSSGNWFKIAVKDEGIYRLSSDFLRSLGVDVNNVNPRNIRIYGNGGFMLPQANSAERIDDLEELGIEVFGEGDGKFDQTDYVLFYASGSTKWQLKNNQYFEHQTNIYTDSSFYFINVDKGLGKRIGAPNNINLVSNYTSDSFNEYQLYEKDLYTLATSSLKSGRNWLGEDFEFNNSRLFNFNTTGIKPNSTIYIKTNLAIRSNVNSSAIVNLNGNNLYNISASALPLTFETDFARNVSQFTSINNFSANNLALTINYNKPNSVSNSWLDFIELNFTKQIGLINNYLRFRDLNSVANGRVTRFDSSNTILDLKLWDITSPNSPINQNYTVSNNKFSFLSNTNVLKEFIAFNLSAVKEPKSVGKIVNQNLHALPQADLIIVTTPNFYSEAKRLADFRKTTQNLTYNLVLQEQVFNEFSSGQKDATAIRDFVKMFYDRGTGNNAPKYLLLFGKGSFDNRSIRFKENNFIVTYQSENSLSPTQSYTSDDYFSLLDDIEGEFSEDFNTSPGLMDLAVGRIPVKTAIEAKNVVDKLITYASNTSFGNWRNQFVIIADDEDNNLHLSQAEANAALVALRNPNFNLDKIYFDAYQQQSIAGGSRYPEVKDAINKNFNQGALLINYTGHGGESGWSSERVLLEEDILNWNNINNLPIIFTATCSFSRWDDPEITSAGELALITKDFGVPSLFSTTRIVFASYNFDLNQSFLRALLDPSNLNKKVAFGDVFKSAKNNNIGGLNINSRNFTLLGDPSALFPIPIQKVLTNQISDTLKAGKKILISGIVTDINGNKLNNFNGFVFPTIYDKPITTNTLGQDRQINGSFVQSFLTQKNIIYKGKTTVTNGDFNFEFIVPKDINLQTGFGKISYYANNAALDATGSNTNLVIGGTSINSNSDRIGPIIKPYLNDENFVDGGITNPSPILLVNLKDESGINTIGIGIGHDIVATLSYRDKNDKIFILNEFYRAKLDSYQEGLVTFPLNNLQPGFYTLKVKAWDVFNNSNEAIINFEVKNNQELVLAHVLNYPNPFTTLTSFQFEHNQAGEDLEVQINVKTISGKLIKTINQLVNSTGNRVNDIFWDGKDNYGDKIAKGVYIYELKVRSIVSGKTSQKIEKLVLF
jgi:hypothetical protein